MESTFRPGIKQSSEFEIFNNDEKKIIEYLASEDWYLTRADSIQMAKSTYRVVLMKPSPRIKNLFNFHREIVVAFSDYDSFEPRSIDAIEYMDIQELRLEEICSIIISKDDAVEQKLNKILKTNEEARVIVPFSYQELLENLLDREYVVNKLRKNFYSRDLFGIQDALKKDLYFFGRRDLIHTLINRHLSGENSGIFGLRKTGKTSILYSIERALDRKTSGSVLIDSQTLHLKSWNTALFFIIQELQKKFSIKSSDLKLIHNHEDEEFVSDYFYDDLRTIYSKNGKRSILIIFDEIENITFDTSISKEWANGQNFIKFWHVIRSAHQLHRSDNIFTYLITGTNPRCIEQPTINKIDNPIFSQFPPIYIPAFDFMQTKEMVDKLGGYMGLQFDDVTCGRLVDDFGGHPLLMRQLCSFIHKNTFQTRPIRITKTDYNILKEKFYEDEQGFIKYAQMVLEVLENWYPDEFQMLTWLSIGETGTFKGLAEKAPEYISHLLNYGIIEKSQGEYSFRIEALKLYLGNKNKYKRLNLTSEERQAEISLRRNSIEPRLRKLVRVQLKSMLGESDAKKKIIKELYGAKEISSYENRNYADFFDPNKHNIYLNTLFELMKKNWEGAFKNLFDTNVEVFGAKATLINHYRKPDAHASQISDADFQSFRGAMEWFEEKLIDI